ncbi:hypothetical protein EJB05_12627, partial [Eragrostis curvula]
MPVRGDTSVAEWLHDAVKRMNRDTRRIFTDAILYTWWNLWKERNQHLPFSRQIFPIFAMEDEHTAYFVVGELGCGVKKVLLVSIDLSNGSVKDVFPYLNGAEDLLGADADMALHKSNCFERFFRMRSASSY